MKCLLPLIPAALAVEAVRQLVGNPDPAKSLLGVVALVIFGCSAVLLGALVVD